MIKILLAAVNAKYIHSNLAIYSLKRYAEDKSNDTNVSQLRISGEVFIDTAEYTINNHKDQIISDLYRRKPDLLAFSCYIWNIEIIKDIVKDYKKISSKAIIWLGGPEAGNNAEKLLEELIEADGIMIGEGEETLYQLICAYQGAEKNNYEEIKNSGKLDSISGIAYIKKNYCSGKELVINMPGPLIDMKDLPFPYYYNKKDDYNQIPESYNDRQGGLDETMYSFNNRQESLAYGPGRFENRIIYYESSRGCPFSCSYCLSSIDKTLRFKDIKKVHEELMVFIRFKVKQVKFVDRTFNCNAAHAINIWRFILENDNGITNFHFEIAADLITEDEFELLQRMRPGLVQLEIGIQSTNPLTIHGVNRIMDLKKAFASIERIRENGNIHQHLDLIAGLPYEDYESFRKSFNDVYNMRPEQLQLGFLKVLKGSPIEKCVKEYGIVFQSRPPYEVLYTKWLSYEDILRLKGIEDMVEVYYNSRQFKHVISYLLHWFPEAFSMYEELAAYYEKRELATRKHNRISRYEILLSFFDEKLKNNFVESVKMLYNSKEKARETFLELLEYDLYLRENIKNRPLFLLDKQIHKNCIKNLIEEAKKDSLYKGSIHIGYFSIDIKLAAVKGITEYKGQYILFDYGSRNILEHDACIKILQLC